MKELFGDFECVKSFEEEHITPWGRANFFYMVFSGGEIDYCSLNEIFFRDDDEVADCYYCVVGK